VLECETEVNTIPFNNPELKRRAFCFLGSVFVHLLILFAAIVFIPPIEFPLQERVTEVVITPHEDLLIPQIERLLSGRSVGAAQGSTQQDRLSEGMSKAESKDAAESQPQVQRSPIDRAPSPPPVFTEGFKLDPSPEAKSGFSLNISPSQDVLPEPDNYLTEKELDLLRYLSSATSAQRPLGTSPSAETYGATISTSGKGSFNINQIDISTWAREVVEKIQKNWAIPESKGPSAKTAVEITVSIGKNGELLNVAIRNSSAVQSFDLAALNAVRMSAPFPELPGNFPNDTLETYFLFQSND
jgi:TonB family protein